jgi:hypothetical protein
MGPKKPKKTKAELEAERLAKEEEDRKQVPLNLHISNRARLKCYLSLL